MVKWGGLRKSGQKGSGVVTTPQVLILSWASSEVQLHHSCSSPDNFHQIEQMSQGTKFMGTNV